MTDKSAKLVVTGQPSMARIEVVDGWLQPVASGYGKLELDVAPGLYEVRADSGLGQTANKYVSLRKDETLPIEIKVAFRSAAPLPDTLDYREDHARAAHRLSKEPMVGKKKSSRLMIFARLLDPEAKIQPSIANLELRNERKKRIDKEWRHAQMDSKEGWIGWCAHVNPGGYLLRWLPTADQSGRGAFEIDQSLWIPEGFLVMLFLGITKWSTNGIGSRDFVTLLQAPMDFGFNPFIPRATKNLWAMEMALAGWQRGRKFINEDSDEIETLLDEKHENPLLGIIAAHSLWRAATPNLKLLRTLHKHFNQRMRDHPDVQALEAHARTRGLWPRSEMPGMPQLSWPPMFVASYHLIRDSPTYIVPDSVAGEISGKIIDSTVWLSWSTKALKAPINYSPEKLSSDQIEILGTWLPGAMQPIASLEWLGQALLDEIFASPTSSTTLPKEIWKRFSGSRDPIIIALKRSILAKFASSWQQKALERFGLLSLKWFVAQSEIAEEVVGPRIQKLLGPLANRWPPRRPPEFLESPQVDDWLEKAVMSEADKQPIPFDLPRVFLSVRKSLLSPVAKLDLGSFATEEDFRASIAQAVAAAALEPENRLQSD